jgi:hypothetical protein
VQTQTPAIEYFSFPGAAGQFFTCQAYRAKLSTVSCAKRCRESQTKGEGWQVIRHKPGASKPVVKNLRINRPKIVRSRVVYRCKPKHPAVGRRSERLTAARRISTACRNRASERLL